MSKYNLTLPKMGESVEEATIVNWLKNVGDNIKMDDFIVEVATDKVDSEVPSDVEGVLIEKCFEINDVVKVGETLCVIEVKEGVSKKNIETIIASKEQYQKELSKKNFGLIYALRKYLGKLINSFFKVIFYLSLIHI